MNAPLQLRLASYLIGVGVVLSLGLGFLLFRAYQATSRVIALSDPDADDTIAHLEALVTAGLLNQIPPHWSSVRWRHISPRKELAVVDQSYRDLERIGDLVSTHVTLSAEEKKYLDDGGHFWPGAVCGYSQGYLRSTGARGDECAWRGESPQGPCGLHDDAHHGQRRSDVE